MFENPRRGRQARHFTKNVPKILDLKSPSEQIFPKIDVGYPWWLILNNILKYNFKNILWSFVTPNIDDWLSFIFIFICLFRAFHVLLSLHLKLNGKHYELKTPRKSCEYIHYIFTRYPNFFHGIFRVLFFWFLVGLIPWKIH